MLISGMGLAKMVVIYVGFWDSGELTNAVVIVVFPSALDILSQSMSDAKEPQTPEPTGIAPCESQWYGFLQRTLAFRCCPRRGATPEARGNRRRPLLA